jgi:hypothetical protein
MDTTSLLQEVKDQLKEINTKLEFINNGINQQHTRISILESQNLEPRLREMEKILYKAVGASVVAAAFVSVLIEMLWK